MPTIREILPSPDVLPLMAAEELAPLLLKAAKLAMQNGQFAIGNIMYGYELNSPTHRGREISIAFGEAWQWLILNFLIMPAEGINGNNGWMVYTRRGLQLAEGGDFPSFRQAAAFPKAMLHQSIADKVWLALARNDLAEAVFAAFKAVEEAVRKAGGFADIDIGTDLMRKAFGVSDGPLTDQSQPKAEREALAHLFAGAIGSYKNPHSHRTVTITNQGEAQEMVMLASHLLRIVDDRTARLRR